MQALDSSPLMIGKSPEIVLEGVKGAFAASAQSVHVDHLPSMSINIIINLFQLTQVLRF